MGEGGTKGKNEVIWAERIRDINESMDAKKERNEER